MICGAYVPQLSFGGFFALFIYCSVISVNEVMYLLCCPGVFVCTDRECNIILGSCQEFLHYPGMLSLSYPLIHLFV